MGNRCSLPFLLLHSSSAEDGVGESARFYPLAAGSRLILCQVILPHSGHRRSCRGSPTAFQRIPPSSQMDRANPQGQRIIHSRDSASMEAAQFFGKMAMKNR